MTATIALLAFGGLVSFALGALSAYVIIAILWPIERIVNGHEDAGEARHG